MGGKVFEHTQVGFGHLFRSIGRDAHAHRRTVHNEINIMGREVGVHAPAIQQVELMAARREQGHGIAERRHQMPAPMRVCAAKAKMKPMTSTQPKKPVTTMLLMMAGADSRENWVLTTEI